MPLVPEGPTPSRTRSPSICPYASGATFLTNAMRRCIPQSDLASIDHALPMVESVDLVSASRQIERSLAVLEKAVSRCREEDLRNGTGVLVALEFLALYTDKQ